MEKIKPDFISIITEIDELTGDCLNTANILSNNLGDSLFRAIEPNAEKYIANYKLYQAMSHVVSKELFATIERLKTVSAQLNIIRQSSEEQKQCQE